MQEKLDKLTGSMVLSHSMLAVTGMVPLGYISFRYGTALTGQFALVIATLSFPTTLVGNAVGQCSISVHLTFLHMEAGLTLFC